VSELTERIRLKAAEEGRLARSISVGLQINWLAAAFAVLIIVGAGMRFWDLGSRAFHHDESLHAWTAWKLFEGQGYAHEPWMHGPFQFFGTAFSFFVFGVSDHAARIWPAVFGSALVALPFLLRRRLGTVGAVLAAAAIAVSPTLLYFSRFARNDIYIAFFTLGLVVALWRYVDDQKPQWLYAAGLLLGLGFATKESIFINAVVLIAFLNVWMAVHFWRQIRDHNKLDAGSSFGVLSALLVSAWALAALWPVARDWRERNGLSQWHPAADFLIILGTLSLPQFAAAIQVPLKELGISDADLSRSIGDYSRENVLGVFTIIALVASTVIIGLRWNSKVWVISAAAFYIPYAVLYTSFFTNLDGFYSGQWGSLNYWLDQQNVHRGNQPWFYYLMLLPAYDFLPLLFAAPALFYYAFRGDVFRRFLVFWAVASMFGYSMAGEKMPWVSVNTALPVVILAAMALGELLTSTSAESGSHPLGAYARPLLAAALGLTAVALGVFGPADSPWIVLRVMLTAVASLGVLWLLLPVNLEPAPAPTRRRRLRGRSEPARPVPWGRIAAVGASAVAGGLLAMTLFVGVRLTYQLGDVPRELLVYTQTSPRVPDVVDGIEEASLSSRLGKDIPVVIDGGIEPWIWYLRDYKQVSYTQVGEGYQPPPGAIVIVLASDEAAMQPYLEQFQEPVRFPLRWWFPEFGTYKTLPTNNVFKFADEFVGSLFRASTWDNWWTYLRYRISPGSPANPEDALGRLDMVAYFPKEYGVQVPTEPSGQPTTTPTTSTATPTPTPQELPALQTLPVGLTLGQYGSELGDFNEPAGLAVDSQGNLYVTEIANDRVQKFDSEGNVLAEVGGEGDGNGSFNEPWGVATDADGNVYVADTFNHRIQVFDSDLKFLRTWGRPASSLENPEPDAFWGPRDVAIDADGNVWVSDGGTGRVLKYTSGGQLIEAFGGLGDAPGNFIEPTSIEIAPGGDIFVADSGNRRVQRFDASFKFLAEYPVPGWLYVDSVAKPYIALLPDGGLILSDPTQNVLFRLDAEGTPIATLNAEGTPLSLPRGVAFDSRGYLYVAEAGLHQVRRLDLSVSAP
jgi:predicted membrane-bound mannosyltransferase/DNA-binding beta-propeller fold protein YncE